MTTTTTTTSANTVDALFVPVLALLFAAAMLWQYLVTHFFSVNQVRCATCCDGAFAAHRLAVSTDGQQQGEEGEGAGGEEGA